MGENFKRFKRKAFIIRLVKSVSLGLSVGALTAGALILLWKLELTELGILPSALIGVGAAVLAFGAAFLLLGGSDASLARRLDAEFGLEERVGTMVAYRESEDGMHLIQRMDAEAALSKIPTRAYRFGRLWLYILLLIIGIGMLVAGIVVKDQREIYEPEPIKPYAISALEEAGIGELIAYVGASELKEPYKAELTAALTELLASLKAASTEPEMQAALATALTDISEITYASSSATEILDALYATEGERMTALALALDTSEMSEPDWGEFADNYTAFKLAMTGANSEGNAELTDPERLGQLKWSLEDVMIKTASGLLASGIKSGDVLYDALTLMTSDGAIEGAGGARGFAALLAAADTLGCDGTMTAVEATLDAMSHLLYDAVAELKINANVGEYVQRKLGVLFGVRIPPFERPSFKDGGSSDEDKEGGSSGGGVGEGVQYGSDDLVLDPLTGKYVKYGELYAKYNTLMLERLDDEKYGYTEAQKRAIQKYFALLYSGLKDD